MMSSAGVQISVRREGRGWCGGLEFSDSVPPQLTIAPTELSTVHTRILRGWGGGGGGGGGGCGL